MYFAVMVRPWSSVVEGDEQPDRANSMECCHASVAYFLGVCHKHNSLSLGPIAFVSFY